MYKILICDPLADVAIDILKEAPDVEFKETYGLTETELCKEIKPFNAVVVRSATTITRKVIKAAENLKVIGRAGSGLDNIDIKYAAKKGIKVFNTPGTNAPAVAELSIGYLFSLARNITAVNSSMKNGEWLKKSYVGREISGKKLGIVGCGTIGKLVAQKAYALGMEIFVAGRSKINIEGIPFEQVSKEKLFSTCDYVSVHLPLVPDTAGSISENFLKLMKPTAYLLNTSRGGVVVEKDLLQALNLGQLAGAAIDVFENEPGFNKELVSHPNVIATPHIAASSLESQERVGVLIIDQIIEFLRSKYMFF